MGKRSAVKLPTLKPNKKLCGIMDTGTFLGVANEIFPDQNWTTRRQFEQHNRESMGEWDLRNERDRGRLSHWAGVHRLTMTSLDYNSLLHRSSVLHEQRNGLPEVSRGDKSYQSPEYSAGFHKVGSTLPLANFGGKAKKLADTYIPLMEAPQRSRTFLQKERERRQREDEDLVEGLDDWRPATPLFWRPAKNALRPDAQQTEVTGI